MIAFLILLTAAVLIIGLMVCMSSDEPWFAFLGLVAVLFNLWLFGGIAFVVVHFITKYW